MTCKPCSDRRYENVVFNGGVFRYDPVHAKSGGNFLEAKPGERVRFFISMRGRTTFQPFTPLRKFGMMCGIAVIRPIALRGIQTHVIGPAGAAILDLVLEKGEGVYPIVTHSLTDALRGGIAILKVSERREATPLMPYIEPGHPSTETPSNK